MKFLPLGKSHPQIVAKENLEIKLLQENFAVDLVLENS
jgi:hypothetical protein